MSERRWRLTKDGEQEYLHLWSDKYRDWLPRDELLPPPPSGPSLTDAEVLEEMGAQWVWWCEYPEFDDPECMTGMDNPRPQRARMPWKHTDCCWVWIVRGAADA